MAQSTFVTCKYCKEKIEKEKAFSDKPRSYFCSENHFNQWVESRKPQKKCYVCHKETGNGESLFRHWICDSCLPAYKQSEEFTKADLIDYVWNLYPKESQDTVLFYALKGQVEKYHKEYGFNYKAMKVAVSYYTNVLEHDWNVQYGLGQIFPKGYYIAAEYYKKRQNLKKQLSTCPLTMGIRTVKGAKIKSLKPLLPLD